MILKVRLVLHVLNQINHPSMQNFQSQDLGEGNRESSSIAYLGHPQNQASNSISDQFSIGVHFVHFLMASCSFLVP